MSWGENSHFINLKFYYFHPYEFTSCTKQTQFECFVSVFVWNDWKNFLGFSAFMQASWDVEEVQAEGIQYLANFVEDKTGKALFDLFIYLFCSFLTF